MATEDEDINEYLHLPDDPEEAFAVLQRRRYKDLVAIWNVNEGGSGFYYERRYVDGLVAFDEVHNLGILTTYRNPPRGDNDFSDFFQDFRRHVEVTSQKILIEAARRQKSNSQSIVVLDASAREAIHKLIQAIREKLNAIALTENQRDSLFNKLNAFAAEIDRNRTRTESFFAFAVELARTARSVNDEIKPLQQTIDRVFDWIEKAKKLKDALPPWNERRKIEGPAKRLPSPKGEVDDDIPF
ncbi:hypothetical protein BJ122_1406 [Rhodopseudomonas faecalis]|uniref:Uncharacterized protein n=1 Tax=Rhodopseudomonas faecalis TaxID=99655 RepID=A0A318T6K7_9BRAD|nr:hypothetical protein [Rhodopseudomonas faecalis]PYE99057.1 hypothetical protein BJ122_1406 [Rhodopseudomonas faecalis]